MLTLAVVVGLELLAVPAWTERLGVASFTSEMGLAHDRVLRIVADSRGFLWFCTAGGLSRFDGHQFVTYDSSTGLRSDFVNDLHEAPDGAYWAATDAGVVRFDPRQPSAQQLQTTLFPVGHGQESNEVYRLLRDRGGRLWAGTLGGLFRMRSDAQGFEPVPLGASAPDRTLDIWSLAEDAEGSLWIGHSLGLSRRMSDGRTLHYGVLAPGPGDDVWDLLTDRDGRLWITQSHGLIALLPDAATQARPGPLPWSTLHASCRGERGPVPRIAGEACRYSTADGLQDDGSGPLLLSGDGHVWVGSGGVSEFDGKRFRPFGAAQGLPDGVISMAEDRHGNIWMGTRTGGARKLARKGLVTYGNGIGQQVTGFVEHPPGEVYGVLRQGGMLARYRGFKRETHVLDVPQKVMPEPYPDVLRDREGGWWVGSSAGLYRFPAVAVSALPGQAPTFVYSAGKELAGTRVARLLEDSRADVWIGYRDPQPVVLTRWSRADGRFAHLGEAEGLPAYKRVSALAESRGGQLIVGLQEGGVFRGSTHFAPLPAVDPKRHGSVLALLVDTAGRLWVGTSRGGLLRLDDPDAADPVLQAYAESEGLAGSSVRALTEDSYGRVYAATGRGIEVLDTLRGRRHRFTKARGLANYYFHAAHRDALGRLWFGTREGIALLDPSPPGPAPERALLISSVTASGVAQPVASIGQAVVGPLTLASDQGQLQITFFELGADGDPTRFQHLLEGTEGTWSTPQAERTVRYAALGPGEYRFRLRLAGAAAGSPEARVDFRILPALWQRTWFRVALALSGLLAVYVAYGVRVRRLLAVERVRTRIATDLHDDIGSSLSRMAILSEVAKRDVPPGHDAATRRLDEIAESARQLLDATSDIVWSIDPRQDTLDDLVARLRTLGAELLEPGGVRWQVQTDSDERVHLEPEQRRHLFLILKEALHNAARHAGARHVTLGLSVKGRWLCAALSDDGTGFDVGGVVPRESRARGGRGLGNMRARAQEMGGRLDVDSRPGVGTELRLKVPIRVRPA